MSTSFSITTPVFDGPLEALLNLIDARKLSISQVSMAEVCDAYLAYVESLPEMPLSETAQFILVASTLLLIKSRTLLPTLELSQDERASVEELEVRLARYALYRKAAKTLRTQWGVAPLLFARRAPIRPHIFSPAEATLETIRAAALQLVRTLPQPERIAQTTVAPVVALEEVIQSLHSRLRSAVRMRFSELTKSTADRVEVIVHFLAMLELVRSGSASVSQDALFSDITIEIEDVATPQYGV